MPVVVNVIILVLFAAMLLGILIYTIATSRPRRQKQLHGPAAVQDAISRYERTIRFNEAPIGMPEDVGRMSPYSALWSWFERRRRRHERADPHSAER